MLSALGRNWKRPIECYVVLYKEADWPNPMFPAEMDIEYFLVKQVHPELIDYVELSPERYARFTLRMRQRGIKRLAQERMRMAMAHLSTPIPHATNTVTSNPYVVASDSKREHICCSVDRDGQIVMGFASVDYLASNKGNSKKKRPRFIEDLFHKSA
jgi:hypothetical protein